MEVEVRLFASLRKDRFQTEHREFPEGTTAGEIIRQLGIVPKDVAILLVNGHHVAEDHVLQARDVLSLFPLVAGG